MANRERSGAASQVSVEAVESLIRELPGVLGARLVVNDWGGVREVHVLADAARPAKSVVRDIESALMARWGLQVDHKRISVAQMVNAPRRPRWVRLRVQRVTVAADSVRGETEVSVSLSPADPDEVLGRQPRASEPAEVWEGRAAGDSGEGSTVRLAVSATLNALNQTMVKGHTFTLVDVGHASVGGRDLVNVLVRYRAPRGFAQVLAGTALVRSGGLDAGVRAALQATNRVAGLAMRRRGEDGEIEVDGAMAVDLDEGPTEAAEEAAA
ncbi:MAG TPA: hypothetical protein VNM16_03330, partial [Bacillota bacterium]|nr:hypothetical protein [Bacillota bacterium]